MHILYGAAVKFLLTECEVLVDHCSVTAAAAWQVTSRTVTVRPLRNASNGKSLLSLAITHVCLSASFGVIQCGGGTVVSLQVECQLCTLLIGVAAREVVVL